jgi:uncharacterized protein YbaP (TraB family)
MKFIRPFAVFSCSFFFSFSVYAQSTTPIPKTMLFRISGKNMKQPSYLFGTLHLKDKRIFHFGDSLYHAIENTDGLAIELNPDEAAAAFIKSLTEKDTTGFISSEINKEAQDRIKKKLEKKFGVKVNRLTRRQAFLARNEWMSSTAKPDDMTTFMDAHLYHIARKMGKWVGGIEDVDDQMNIIKGNELDFNADDLVADINLIKGTVNEMIEMYVNGDLGKIYDFATLADDEMQRLLFINRNLKMTRRIDSIMQLRTGVFAVGAAHLPGDSGLITLLQSKGYKVEPVFSSKKIKPEEYKLKSEFNYWKTFSPADSIYSISYPGASSTMYGAEDLVKMEMCVDIPTSTFYLSTGVPNMRKGDKEKLLDEMMKNFYRDGKLIEKKKIELNGEKGVEFVFEKDMYMRARIFITEGYAFIVAMGHDSKKEVITGEDAERYFSSFKFLPNAMKPAGNWQLYTNNKLAFSVLLPAKPQASKPDKNEEWLINNFNSLDNTNQVFFMISVKSAAPGFYLNGDSNYFSLLKQTWAANSYEQLKEETFMMGEYPAFKCDLMKQEGKEKYVTKTISVSRGSRTYLLIAAVEKGNENHPSIERFFNSFRLTDYQPANWSVRQSPDKVFSTATPGIIYKKDLSPDDSVHKNWSYYTYDTATAVTYEVQPVSFVDYYHAKSDSAVFHDALNALKEYSDSVIERRMVNVGPFKAQDVRLYVPGLSMQRRLRLVLNGDTVYAVNAFLHPSIINSETVNRYFNEFVLHSGPVAGGLFQKKTKQLFEDLASNDSVRFDRAASRIAQVVFDSTDLPLLKEALLKHYQPAEENYSTIYNSIADEIYNIRDSSIIKFIAKEYFSVKIDNEAQRIAMLRLLTLINTRESFAVLKDLLLSQPPYTDYLYPVKQYITDSLALTATLFPEMMRLSSDTNYFEFTGSIANQLLDSNLITQQSLLPYEANLVTAAEEIYNRFQTTADINSWYYYPLLQLMARLNTPKLNQLLLKIVALKKNTLNMSLLPDVLTTDQPVPATVIEATAADKSSRFLLYRKLDEKKITSFFPKKYSSQKMIAEADVYVMASDENEVDDQVYLQSRKRTIDGVEKVFYLFKVKIGDEWYLGISGGYSTDAKKIVLPKDDDIGGIYWTEPFNNKKVDEQFEAYFEER